MIIKNNKIYAAVFIIASVLFIFFVFIPSTQKINTDFPNYYTSANMYLDNKDMMDLYDNVQFNKQVLMYGIEDQIVSFMPYPPVNALVMLPLARLEPGTSKLVWNFLNLIFFAYSVYFISKISDLNLFATGLIFFASGYALANNFFFGQVYLLVLMLLTASLYYNTRGSWITAAVLFSLSVVLKFYTVFFILLFLLNRKYRLVLYSILLIIVFNLIAFIVTGFELNIFYYKEIMPRVSDGWVGLVYAPEYQSFISLLHTLFNAEPSLNPDPLISNPGLYYVLKYMFYIAILFVSSYYVLNSDNDNRKVLKLHIALFCFVCMLLLPVNASYQYVILIPAIAILLRYLFDLRQYFRAVFVLGLFMLMNSPVALFLLNAFKGSNFFFLGYIKLYILVFFWAAIIFELRKHTGISYAVSFPRFNFLIAPLLFILILTKMSLEINKTPHDGAVNILNNNNYMISMPAYKNGKMIYSECRNEKFVANSNFGFYFDKENIFEPEFLNDEEIVYETIANGRKIFKKLNLNTKQESIIENNEELRSRLKDTTVKCYSEEGHIFFKDATDAVSRQLTTGNSHNIRPVYVSEENKIIFCSDRNRGAGFTTLYEIKVK